MKFLDGISATRKEELLSQLRAIWTHDSTAIEGNTLTLGDTMFVLQYGLTVKGKPLKDQQDVQNHARAVDRVLKIYDRGRLDEADLFDLHRLVINEQTTDIYKPVGAYKREDNGTYRPTSEGGSVYYKYVSSDDVPGAMRDWLAMFNGLYRSDATDDELVRAYVRAHVGFTAIHPFFDGNGRLARLVSNLPVLFAGLPPIVIPLEFREDYLKAIWSADGGDTEPFESLVRTSWKTTLGLVREARQ